MAGAVGRVKLFKLAQSQLCARLIGGSLAGAESYQNARWISNTQIAKKWNPLASFSSTANNGAQPKTGSPEDTVPEHDTVGRSEETETEVEKTLRLELNKAVSENAKFLSLSREFEDKYKRALAETENLRTRLTKQISDSKLYAIQGFCKDMTEISDILRLAIDSVPKDQLTDQNPHLKNLYDGLSMTESRLMQVFKAHGLTQINPLDEKFNPNEHEAVVQQPVDGKDSGTVIFVSKVGYKLHERVIRPAVVGVAK